MTSFVRASMTSQFEWAIAKRIRVFKENRYLHHAIYHKMLESNLRRESFIEKSTVARCGITPCLCYNLFLEGKLQRICVEESIQIDKTDKMVNL